MTVLMVYTYTQNVCIIWITLSLVGCVIKEELTSEDDSTNRPPPINMPTPIDQDRDGYTTDEGDCDDERYDINPSRPEICDDGIDQDCDGRDLSCYEIDNDGDGFSVLDGDCDDRNVSIAPDRFDVCDDNIDQDCNGQDLSCEAVDDDGDGYSVITGDCAEGNPRRHPGAMEQCGDGIDQDCDGVDLNCDELDQDLDGIPDRIDNCPQDFDPRGLDSDQDGYGDRCDNCPSVANPEQTDSDSDDIGDACSGQTDIDGDGVSVLDGDCNDQDPSISPQAEERCDEIDHDCDQYPDEGCQSDIRSAVVTIAQGPSLLGSTLANPQACLTNPDVDENCDEVPQRQITLDEFRIEIHEVTHAQYGRCITFQYCTLPLRVDGIESSQRFGDPNFNNHPMTWITQAQAKQYCQWLGGRLPSEVEWERAARGGQPLLDRRYLSDNTSPNCTEANLGGCQGDLRPVMTTAGDLNDLGLYDLIGNAHELVSGYYDPIWYRTLAELNPQPPTQGNDRQQISVRGGAYNSASAFSTITYRGFRLLMRRDRALPEVGFRCVFTH